MATSTSYIPNHKSMPATSAANPQQQMQKPVNEMLEHSNGSVGAPQPMTAAAAPSPPQPSVQTFPSVHINPTTFPVYIGNLGSDITESHLVPFVHSSGVSLSSARVCRSSDTRKSLNYAFLNFHSKEDADIAISKLNYLELGGKAVRMAYSQRDPTLRKSGKGNVIIKNLGSGITPRKLYDTLSDVGPISSVSVKPSQENPNLHNAYVQFEDEENAKAAIKYLENTEINGYQIEINIFQPQKETFELRDMKDELFVNCYVKNLPRDIVKSEEDLHKMFSEYGEITSAKLVYDSSNNMTGSGFVCFKNHEEALNACEKANGIIYDQDTDEPKSLLVTRFQRKSERMQYLKDKFDEQKITPKPINNNVYIKNLDSGVTDAILLAEFSKFGKVISAKVMRQETGQSRGFGFVSYENPKDALKAIQERHQRTFYSKPLHCELAQKQSERRQNIANQMMLRSQYMFPGQSQLSYFMKPAGTPGAGQFVNAPTPSSNYFTNPMGAYQQYFPGNQSRLASANQMQYQNFHSNGVSTGLKSFGSSHGGSMGSNNHRNNSDQQNMHQNYNNYARSSNYQDNNYRFNSRARNYNSNSQQQHRMQHGSQSANAHQQQSSHNTQIQVAPLTEQEKNMYGHSFVERIRKMNNPQLTPYASKIAGIFLQLDLKFCQQLDDEESFKKAVNSTLSQILNQASTKEHVADSTRGP